MNESEVKNEMQSAIEHFREDLKNIRTARANSGMVEGVMVEVYGTKMRMREVANITTPEARQILITPYDPQNANAIAKAIDAANLNLNVAVDGNAVRIIIAPMDAQVRKEMSKKCKEKAENAKIKVREIRRKFNEKIKKAKQSSEISEDEMKKSEKTIQDMTDKFCKDIDAICVIKEKEVLEV